MSAIALIAVGYGVTWLLLLLAVGLYQIWIVTGH